MVYTPRETNLWPDSLNRLIKILLPVPFLILFLYTREADSQMEKHPGRVRGGSNCFLLLPSVVLTCARQGGQFVLMLSTLHSPNRLSSEVLLWSHHFLDVRAVQGLEYTSCNEVEGWTQR